MIAWLLHNTILAALLAAGVLVLCRVARPNPAVRHVLWLIVLVRLLMPPGLHWPWSVPLPESASATPELVAVEPAPAATHITSVPAEHDSALSAIMVEDVTVVETELRAADEVSPAAAWPKRLALWVTWGWCAGVVIFLLRHLLRVVHLSRAVARGTPAPAPLTQRVCELAGKLMIRPPRVLVVPGLASPLVGCLPRPVLLWPEGLDERLSKEGLRAVLAHELAHLRRRDHWVRWLELVAECLWWWNPVFLFVRRRIRQNAELACDAWVLTVMPKARRAYAEALLTVCETVSRCAEPAPVLGVGGDDRRDFQRRLTMIMREPVACRLPRRTLLAVGVLALLSVPGWTLGQRPAPESVPANEDTSPTDVEIISPVFVDPIEARTEVAWLDLVTAAERVKAQPASAERDKKLKEIEDKIQAMIKEIHALRQKDKQHELTEKLRAAQHANYARAVTQAATVRLRTASALKQKDGETTLSRATYTLPPEKAKALDAFLKTYLKASVVETKLEGDKLTITTTPDAQRALRELIGLIQSTPARAGSQSLPVKPVKSELHIDAPDRVELRNFTPAALELKSALQGKVELNAKPLEKFEFKTAPLQKLEWRSLNPEKIDRRNPVWLELETQNSKLNKEKPK
jgi:beta-lactamase regulating signal transducer with metallopeptidase domain/arginine repressor